MRNRRQEQVKLKKKRRQIVSLTLGILIFVYLSLTLIFGENGLLRYMNLKSVKSNLQAEINAIKKQNEEIKKQIDTLKGDPNTVEELAREQGLTKKDEWTFKFEDEQ